LNKKITEAIKKAGVVGAGGAGFPTHIKVQGTANWVIVNGAECEPLLRVDQQLLAKYPAQILKGLEAILLAVGATKGIIALKGKYTKAIDALKRKIGTKPIELFILDDFYPAGDEQVTVYEVLKKVVPEGGIPLKVGCVVVNVETLYNVARALDGVPVTTTFLTVTGEVPKAFTSELPVGLSIRECLTLAGVKDTRNKAVIEGGPMMGSLIDNLDSPITKTTKGLIVLPEEHPLVIQKRLGFAYQLKRSKAACIQCSFCTEICPRHLLGHSLEPHKIMRALNYLEPGQEVFKSAFLCSECGACEYICPMGLSPREANALLKQELGKKGLKAQASTNDPVPRPMREYKKIPSKRLIMRFALSGYDRPAPLVELKVKASRVAIPLKQHLGSPARAKVKLGDKVQVGDLLAACEEVKLGADVHASISGMIKEVSDRIVIEAETR